MIIHNIRRVLAQGVSDPELLILKDEHAQLQKQEKNYNWNNISNKALLHKYRKKHMFLQMML